MAHHASLLYSSPCPDKEGQVANFNKDIRNGNTLTLANSIPAN